MATFRGISAVGQGVLDLLKAEWASTGFDAAPFTVKLCKSDEFDVRPVAFGVTGYVFRVGVNGTQRTVPPSLIGHRRPLPVEVSILLTPWATSAQQELDLLGWMLRTIEDQPVLAAHVLNTSRPAVFGPDEAVELVLSPTPMDDFLRLWDAFPYSYQLSTAYVARVIRLESELTITEAGPVLEREHRHGLLVEP